uniref:Uncharacterized protein n=1 Tax=Cyprinus carpio carpio TaxID=630221 RepID=A0A9J8CIS9_CYPCA
RKYNDWTIFNWNGFGATSDWFVVQSESVDSAFTDGVIKAVSVLPYRVLDSIGQHTDTCFLASCVHDQLVKFWDISSLPDMRVSHFQRRKNKERRLKALSNKAFDTGQDFFSGLLDSTEENCKKTRRRRRGRHSLFI